MIYKHGICGCKLCKELKFALMILDAWTQLIFGKEIVVTSTWREKGAKPSFHPKWQAADLRTRDLPDFAHTLWEVIIKKVNETLSALPDCKGKFDMVYEPAVYDGDKLIRQQHGHLEWDTKDPI